MLAHVIDPEDKNKTLCGKDIPQNANKDFFWHHVARCFACLRNDKSAYIILGAQF